MPPLLACFPVCLTFTIMALFGIALVILGVGRDVPVSPPEPPDPSRVARRMGTATDTGPPPWWVFALMCAALVALLFVLNAVSEG